MARAVKCNHRSCGDVTIRYMDEAAETVRNEADELTQAAMRGGRRQDP